MKCDFCHENIEVFDRHDKPVLSADLLKFHPRCASYIGNLDRAQKTIQTLQDNLDQFKIAHPNWKYKSFYQ